MAALVLAAFAIRIAGIDARTFAHPENFAPGLNMPDWADKPGERTSFLSVLYGTLVDGHPPAYFLVLLPWVKAFGTSLLSLRLPSALLGAASVWMLFLIGRREHGAGVGLIAAAMLAAHSYHIYWSQMARMYAPVAFLCLLSTLLLLDVVKSGTLRSTVLYVIVTATALWTQLYAWPLLVGHVAWTAAGALARRPSRKALRAQALSFVLGAPVIQLSLFQNPATRWHQSAFGYLEFGYLFDAKLPYWHAEPSRPSPLLVLGLCIALLAIGFVVAARRQAPVEQNAIDHRGINLRYDWILGGLVTLFMLLLAWRWLGVSATVWAVSVVPVSLPGGVEVADRVIARVWQQPVRRAARLLAAIPLSAILAFLPVAIMLAVSLVRGVYVARGTLVFVPYVLLLAAVGLHYLLTCPPVALRAAGVLAAGMTVFVFFFGFTYQHLASTSPRDYAGLARELRDSLQPSDLVLVRNDYRFPPLFYYLPRSLDPQLVPDHYHEVLSARNPDRVWVVKLCYGSRGIDAMEAVSGMNPSLVVRVTGAEAWLYERGGTGGTRTFSPPHANSAKLGGQPGDPGDEDNSVG